jgi:hypothetical protein
VTREEKWTATGPREKNRGRAGRSFSLANPWRQAELDSHEAKRGQICNTREIVGTNL